MLKIIGWALLLGGIFGDSCGCMVAGAIVLAYS